MKTLKVIRIGTLAELSNSKEPLELPSNMSMVNVQANGEVFIVVIEEKETVGEDPRRRQGNA
jgi:hypothetical protein